MKHLVIPDTQVKDCVDLTYLDWVGRYIVDHRPDVIIHIGDFADMPSLSLYDVGKKSFEGRRYLRDIEVAKAAMQRLLAPMREYNALKKKNKEKLYKPRMIMTLGNHEDRISRAVNADSKLEGVMSVDDLGFAEQGWEVYPYLQPVIVNGIVYCHYFTSGIMGRPVTSAQLLLQKKHQSCVMGHVQDRQIAYSRRADGRQITGIFAGCCYLHDEDYLGQQGNDYWRGIWVLHEVNEGSFDEMPVSMGYLRGRYGERTK